MSQEKAREFYELVKRMRKAQKEHESSNTQENLNRKKELESAVDNIIGKAEVELVKRRIKKALNE